MYMYRSTRTLTHARATRSSHTYIPLGYDMLTPRREDTSTPYSSTRTRYNSDYLFPIPPVAVVQPYYSSTAVLRLYPDTAVPVLQQHQSTAAQQQVDLLLLRTGTMLLEVR